MIRALRLGLESRPGTRSQPALPQADSLSLRKRTRYAHFEFCRSTQSGPGGPAIDGIFDPLQCLELGTSSSLRPECLRGRLKKSNVGEDFLSGQSRFLCGVGIFALALLGGDAIAHTPKQPPHQTYSEGDLKLESGEVIKDFSI